MLDVRGWVFAQYMCAQGWLKLWLVKQLKNTIFQLKNTIFWLKHSQLPFVMLCHVITCYVSNVGSFRS